MLFPIHNSLYFKKIPLKNEQGAILILSILLIAVISVLGVAAFNISFSERKIAYKQQDKLRAEQAAKSAAILAKEWLQKQCFKPQPKKSNNASSSACAAATASIPSSPTEPYILCGIGNVDLTSITNQAYWTSDAWSLSLLNKAIPNVATPPKIIIYELAWDPINQVQPYQIIAQATGSASDTIAYATLAHEKFTPIPELGARTTQGRGNLFNIKILNIKQKPSTAGIGTFGDNYLIPNSPNNADDQINVSASPDNQWFMCVRDNGKIVFRPYFNNQTNDVTFMQAKILTPTVISGPSGSLYLELMVTHKQTAGSLNLTVKNNDYTKLPPENIVLNKNPLGPGLNWYDAQDGAPHFNFNFLYKDSNGNNFYTIRAENGLWLSLNGRYYNSTSRKYEKIDGGRVLQFDTPLSAVASGVEAIGNDPAYAGQPFQKFIIQITGDVNP